MCRRTPSPVAFPTGCADEALSSLNGCELLLGVLLDVAVDEPAPATYAFCSLAPRAVRVASPITPLWILRLLQRKVLRDAGMSPRSRATALSALRLCPPHGWVQICTELMHLCTCDARAGVPSSEDGLRNPLFEVARKEEAIVCLPQALLDSLRRKCAFRDVHMHMQVWVALTFTSRKGFAGYPRLTDTPEVKETLICQSVLV